MRALMTYAADAVRELCRNPHLGMWAFALQRLTGVVLTLYMLPHLLVIGGFGDAAGMTERVQRVTNPFLETLLLAAIAFHAANGLRVILVDVGAGARRHKVTLGVVVAFAGVVVLAGGAKLLMGR